MNILRVILPGWVIFLSFSVAAQKGDLKQANELYKAKRYAEAAPLFESILKEKTSLSIQTKLANCYRLNYRLVEAEALYAKIVQQPKAKSDTYFYYAETLMGNEKYSEAKKWFLKYAALEPDDEKGKLMAAACDAVPSIQPFFKMLRLEEFKWNTAEDDFTPVFFKNGIVFSSDRNSGLRLMKEKSGWTGRDFLNLYVSPLKEDGTYAKPSLFSNKINELNKNTSSPSFFDNQERIVFTRNGFETSKNDAYNMQLFESESSDLFTWKTPKKIDFCSPESNYMHPAVSPDGKWLVFVSDKGRGIGGTDLYISKKTEKGWGRPENLGATINTSTHEGFPFFDSEGKLFFCSKGHPGYGGFDIFMTKKMGGEWIAPVNLGRPINSSHDDISICIDNENRRGLFSSNRLGGDDDIFFFKMVEDQSEAGFFPAQQPNKDDVKAAIENNSADVVPVKSPNNEIDTTQNTPKYKTGSSAQNNPPNVPTNEVELQNRLPLSSISEDVSDLKAGDILVLKNAKFGHQVHQITPKIVADLQQLAQLLKSNPSLRVELGAHTDSYGPTTDNLKLSQNRAVNAAMFLYMEGIDNQQLIVKGYGESQLLNECADGVDCPLEKHLDNQRLEVKILSK